MDTLLIAALMSTISGVLYAYLASLLARRPVSQAAKGAQVCFALWWGVLGVSSFLSAIQVVLYVAGVLPVWFFQAAGQLLLTLILLGLAGLLFYLIFVYTGRSRSWKLLAAYYGALYLVLLALVAAQGTPTSISDDGWRLQRVPEPEANTLLGVVFGLLFIGPQIAAAVAYALLYRRAASTDQRYRIALVSGSIIVWFASSLVAGAIGASNTFAGEVASQVLGMLAAATILLAYEPPRAWRAKWGLKSIRDEIAHG